MTIVSLYDDQTDLVLNATASMKRHKNVLIQAATGFGKTRLAAHMIDRARLKGNRAGMLLPRKELLRQTSLTMAEFNIPYGVFAAGHTANPFAKVQLISTQTLSRRLNRAPELDILFIDETHFGGSELDAIISHYRALGIWIIGLSATPMKMNGKAMGDWYDDLVLGPSIRWLMDNGRLSDFRMFAPDCPDLSAIPKSNGDYVKKHVDSYMASDEAGKVLVGNAANHYKSHAEGKLNISFCTSVKNSEMTAQMFNDKGIPSAAVSGETSDADLRRIIRAYANRELRNLCCAQLLEFGFDLSQASGVDVTIESMSDLCPSRSLPRQMQRWGRVLRAKEYPAVIFDHVNNSQEHGLPDEEREWTLEPKIKRKGGNSEPTMPTRQCPACFYVHRPTPTCPNCGHVYEVQSRDIEEVEGELQEVERVEKERKKQVRMEQGQCKTYSELVAHFVMNGSKNPHARAKHVINGRKRR